MKIVGKFGWRVKVGRDLEIGMPKCVVVVLNPRRVKREAARSGKNLGVWKLCLGYFFFF